MTRNYATASRKAGQPPTGDEAALCAWIAEQAAVTVHEVREARAAARERRALPSTGDPDLDAVRRAVEAALDGKRVRSLPRAGTRARTAATPTPRPPQTTDTAARRAADYWRNRR